MGTHFYTSITAGYLPKARVLATSIRQHAPACTIHLLLNDAVPTWFDLASEPFDHLITLDQLPILNRQAWIFSHDLVELSTASKGFALCHILDLPDCDGAVYLDPDIVVLSPLGDLLEEFSSASVLLTPHLTEPEKQTSAITDNELSALQHGVFNLGFLGVRNSPEGRRFAQWWSDRLRDFCFDDKARGLFTDQRWADLIPAYFPDHKILRNPGYNVATWNLTGRQVTGDFQEGFQVNGQALVFYHFSGLDSGSQAGMLARYGSHMPALQLLREWYVAECDLQGQAELSSISWAYSSYSNGQPILPAQRRLYRETPSFAELFPNPFQCDSSAPSFLDWYNLHVGLQPISPFPSPKEHLPAYRIFVIAGSADVTYLGSTLGRLLAATENRGQLWLVTNPDLPTALIPPDLPVIFADATRYEDLAASILRDFADRDLILIRAGAVPPSQWDLRLAWAVARNPSCLAVSPIDRRILDEPGTFADVGAEELDGLCYWFRPAGEVDAPYLSHDCLYIQASALQDVLPQIEQRRLSALSDRARRLRYQILEAPHICLSFECPLNTTAPARPDLRSDRFARLRTELRNYSAHSVRAQPESITQALTGPTLHVMHSWGGGVEQWLSNFAEADRVRENLVLRSVGPSGQFGQQLCLFRYGGSEPVLLHSWTLAPPIRATALAHAQYREVLFAIDKQFGIDRVIVSSLIGHSLDCLRFKPGTIVVCHDYYPFCSAINITFGGTCRSCEAPRLQACLEENPHNRFFPNVVRDEWLVLRAEWLRTLRETEAILVAPSPSVLANYEILAPELAPAFRLIPHGGKYPPYQSNYGQNGHSPLSILMLGSLGLHKGLHLFESLLTDLPQFAQITLAGCFDYGELFARNPQIRVIDDYRPEQLAQIVAEVKPDVGLLLSAVPETFSFTLQEFQSMGIPPLATRTGSFNNFIQEGVTGFLCDPEPACILQRLRGFAADRSSLHQVHDHLRSFQARSTQDMVSDYAELTPLRYSAVRYFNGPHSPEPLTSRALQIYWHGCDGSFSEEDSFVFAPYHLGHQTARLYLSRSPRGLQRLRLDIASEPGVFSLYRLALFTHSGELVWHSNGGRFFFDAASLTQAFPLSETELCLTGDDPSMILPLPAQTLAKLNDGGFLEVEFKAETTLAHAADLRATAEAGWAARREVTALQQELGDELNQMNRQLAQFEYELEATDRFIDALEAERERLVAEKRAAETNLAQANQDLQLSRDHSQNLSDNVHQLNEALRLSQDHSKNLTGSLAKLNEAVKLSHDHSSHLEMQNQSLQQSLSWKLTEPVRLAGRLGRKLKGS